MPIISVDEFQIEPLFTSPSNVKCSNTDTVILIPDNSKLLFVSQTQLVNDKTPLYDESEDEESPIISDKLGQKHYDVAAQLNKVFDE